MGLKDAWKNFDEYYEKHMFGLLMYINEYQRQYLSEEQICKLGAALLMQEIINIIK